MTERKTYLCVTGDYKPGDPAPEGYLERIEWARVQMKAGLIQRRCPGCGKYKFTHEKCCHAR